MIDAGIQVLQPLEARAGLDVRTLKGGLKKVPPEALQTGKGSA